MSWVAVGVGGASLLGGLISSQGASSAASQQVAAQQQAAQLQKQFGLDAEQMNLMMTALNRQASLGPQQTQLTAWNLLQQGLGAPGYGTTGTGAGTNVLAPGAAATPSTVSPFQGSTYMSATGTPINLPPGLDLNQIFGPVSSAQVTAPSGFAGSLLQSPTSAQIQANLNPELAAMQKAVMDQLIGAGAAQGQFGGGGMLSAAEQAIAPLEYQAWQQSQKYLTGERQNILSNLMGIATGSPSAIQGAGSLGATGAAEQASLASSLGGNLAQTASNIGSAQAQGTLGQSNAWANALQQMAGIGTKYAQSSTSYDPSQAYSWGGYAQGF